MSKRDALEVGIKLIGLYCAYEILGELSTMTSALSRPTLDPQTKPSWMLLCLPAVAYTAAAVTFVFKGRAIAQWLVKDSPDETAATPAATSACRQLPFALRLLGFFFFIQPTAFLASSIVRFAIEGKSLSWHTPYIVTDLVKVLLALALIFWNTRIASFVEERSPKSSASTPPGC